MVSRTLATDEALAGPGDIQTSSIDFFRDLATSILPDGWRLGAPLLVESDLASFLAARSGDRPDVVVNLIRRSAVSPGKFLGMTHDVTKLLGQRSDYLALPLRSLEHDDVLCVFRDFIPGRRLSRILEQSCPTVGATLSLAESVLEGLQELHARGIIHRMVWPRSIIVDTGSNQVPNWSQIKLVNIGTSVVSSHEEEARAAHRCLCYLSPESLGAIESNVTPSSDLYSLGVILFECLMQNVPFVGDTNGDIIYSHMTNALPEMQERVPEIVQALLRKLLEKDPALRYQTAEGVLHDVRRIRTMLQPECRSGGPSSTRREPDSGDPSASTSSSQSQSGQVQPTLLLGRNDHRSRLTQPGFVGRQSELEVAKLAMEAAATKKSSYIAVDGVSGFGKTRMLVELERMAARARFWVIRTTATAELSGKSMLDEVVNKIVRRARQDEAFHQRIARINHANRGALIQLFPELTCLWTHDMQPPTDMSQDNQRVAQIHAVANLFASIGTADQPLMLVLDDCHWADDLAIGVIQYLSSFHKSEYLVAIISYRGNEVPADAPLHKSEMTHRFQVGPLANAAVVSLLESMAGALPKEVIDRIVRSSEGSPFMASALLRGLTETGALTSCDGQWKLTEGHSDVLTSSNQAAEIIARRTELLAPETRQLLSAGAVLGLEFDLDGAIAIAGVERAQAMQALEEARARQLIWVTAGESHVAFVHDRIRRSLLYALDETQLAQVHRDAAKHLKQREAIDHAAIARHLYRCGDFAEALPHAFQAAEAARNKALFDVAEQQYRIAMHAIDLTQPNSPLAHRVAFSFGSVCMHRGNYPAAEAAIKRAIDLSSSDFQVAHALGKLGELAQITGETALAAIRFGGALSTLGITIPKSRTGLLPFVTYEAVTQILHSLLPGLFVNRVLRKPNDEERLRLWLLTGLATAYWYSGTNCQKFWAHLKCLNFAERFQPGPELARAYGDHALGMTLFGITSRGIKYVRRSLQIRKEGRDISGQGQALFVHACVLLADGRFEDAITKGRQALPLLERMGDYYWIHFTRYQIAASLIHLGRLDEGLAEAQRAYQSAIRIGDYQTTGVMVDLLAKSTLAENLDEIIAAERSRNVTDPQRASHVSLGAAARCLEQGQLQEALTSLKQCVKGFETARVFNIYTVESYVWLVTVYRRLAETVTIRSPRMRKQLIKKAAKAVRKARNRSYVCKPYKAHLLREIALLHALRGWRRRAHRAFQKSLRVARQQHARYQFGWTCLEYGEFLIAEGDANGKRLVEIGRRRMKQCRASAGKSVPNGSTDTASSYSLADRFDTVLDAGRSIAAAWDRSEVFQLAHDAALRTLRAERCAVFEIEDVAHGNSLTLVYGDQAIDVQMDVVRRSIQSREPITAAGNGEENVAVSTICIPIRVREEVVACIYMTHGRVRDLFGEDEHRLAAFIAAIAGAACENAEGFAQLQNLNKTLEHRVAERTADAEAANEAKSQFLATMTHELRTPMNGILGMTELALNTELSATQRGYLTTAKQSGQSLLLLLNDVLDLSKIEAGKMTLEEIAFDVRETVSSSLSVLSTLAANKTIELIGRIDSNVPMKIMGDPNRLRQVIVNIVGNAVKFTGEGHVLVEVNSWQGASSDVLRITISDTGIGIPEEKLDVIFKAFEQSDHSTTRRYGGTGLGLSITAEIVKQMGGVVSVESQIDRGSRFTIDIPLTTGKEAAKDRPDWTGDRLAGRRALLLVDQPQLQSACRELLQSFGLSVDVGSLKRQAPDDPQRARYDFLVADLGPGMATAEPALEMIASLRNAQPTSSQDLSRWLVLTPADGTASLVGSHLGIVLKPIHSSSLWDALCAIDENILPRNAIQHTSGPDGTLSNDHAATSDAATNPSPAEPDALAAPLKILLADDGLVNQEVARGLLELKGYEVTCVDNGRQAVQKYSQEYYDVILMDLEMPEMDGLEATSRIREIEAETGAERITIFAMTAHMPGSFRDQFNAGELDGYLTKPVQPELLFDCIESSRPGHTAIGSPASC